jgi:hypothetical protein
LEGEEKDVEEIYMAVMNDTRNKGNILIEKKQITERMFSGWSMGFRHLTHENKDDIRGYTEFLNTGMGPEAFSSKHNEVIGLLYQFKKNA